MQKKKIASALLSGVLSVAALGGISGVPYANAVKVNNTGQTLLNILTAA